MEPMGLKVASKKLRTLAALPGLTHATTSGPTGGKGERCLHEGPAFPTPASVRLELDTQLGQPSDASCEDRHGGPVGVVETVHVEIVPEVRREPHSRMAEQVASWDELAAATASPATSYEQKVEATDPGPRPSDGGNEPGVVGAPVPVRTELPQPVVGDVVTETEDGVRRESDDGFKP